MYPAVGQNHSVLSKVAISVVELCTLLNLMHTGWCQLTKWIFNKIAHHFWKFSSTAFKVYFNMPDCSNQVTQAHKSLIHQQMSINVTLMSIKCKSQIKKVLNPSVWNGKFGDLLLSILALRLKPTIVRLLKPETNWSSIRYFLCIIVWSVSLKMCLKI